MEVRHLTANFEDERGAITDIFVNEPQQHITVITTKKGGVRGNHYHKVSVQSDFLVSGNMRVLGQNVGEDSVTEIEWNPGDLILWKANEAHEFIALTDSVFMTFVNGIRGGNNFEKDTYRLDTPLHEHADSKGTKGRSSR